MIYKIYLIIDDKVGYQPQVYTFINDDVAKRWFNQLYKDSLEREPNGTLASYPFDFKLYCVGDLHTDTGSIDSIVPKYICTLSDFTEV